METTTNQSTTKKATANLKRKIMKKFLPIAEEMRAESQDDREIVDAFNRYADLKQQELYRKERVEPKLLAKPIMAVMEQFEGIKEDSKIERIFYELLTEAKLPVKFQYKIGPYRADFLIGGFLVFEIDGPMHDKGKDAIRDDYMTEFGYLIFRVPAWLAAADPSAVIIEIQELVTINEFSTAFKTEKPKLKKERVLTPRALETQKKILKDEKIKMSLNTKERAELAKALASRLRRKLKR